MEEKEDIIKSLYDGRPKNERDVYLTGLIEYHDIKRRRPVKENSTRKHSGSFSYFVMKQNERIKVCHKAFLSLHSVSSKAVFRLCTLMRTSKSPKDMRGKHANRGNLIDNDLVLCIDEHIKSFPTKQSHYEDRLINYLDPQLTVRKMHELFCSKYPEHVGKIKYEYYLKYFNENYGYRFGRPQVDVCSTCEELNIKIKSSFLNDNAKRAAVAELLIHKRRAKKFYLKLQEVAKICAEKDDVAAIAFDYMQNLPLPFLPVQEVFYLRKLWQYVFCIHNLKDNGVKFYTYHEGIAARGPNEVCSFLMHYFMEVLPSSIKEVYVFSDACSGQNRNHSVIRLLLAMTMNGRFSQIHQYYPIRGHSFLPCDRDFSVVKRQVKHYDRVYVPSQYIDMMKVARKNGSPFDVFEISNENIKNFKDWWPKFFKKTTKSVSKNKNEKEAFTISKYRHLEYKSNHPGYVTTTTFIDGIIKYSFHLKKSGNNTAITLPTEFAYGVNGKKAINVNKIQDIAKIIQHIPGDYRPFYNDILQWPTVSYDSEEE